MQTPYRRLRGWRAKRRQRKATFDGGDCADCASCGDCSPFLVSPLMAPMLVLRLLAGALRTTAVDPCVTPPARVGARAAARLVRSYQLHVSVPRARPVCPMTPTCSRYGLQALSRHGLLRGGLLVAQRLRRCGGGGASLDPVPAETVQP